MDYTWKESDEAILNHEILYIESKDQKYLIIGRATYKDVWQEIEDGEDGEDGEYGFVTKLDYIAVNLYDASNLKNPQKLGEFEIIRAISDIEQYIYNDNLYLIISASDDGGLYIFHIDSQYPQHFKLEKQIIDLKNVIGHYPGNEELLNEQSIEYLNSRAFKKIHDNQTKQFVALYTKTKDYIHNGIKKIPFKTYQVKIYDISDTQNMKYYDAIEEVFALSLIDYQIEETQYLAIGSKETEIIEVTPELKLERRGKIKISTLALIFVEINGKHCIIAPSVHFISILNVGNPSRIIIESTLPISQYVFGTQYSLIGGQKYLIAIGYNKIIAFNIQEDLKLSIKNQVQVGEGSMDLETYFGASTLWSFQKDGEEYLAYQTIYDIGILKLSFTCIKGYYLNNVNQCIECPSYCSSCTSSQQCTECLSHTRTGDQCQCRNGYREINNELICEKIKIPEKELPQISPNVTNQELEPIKKEDNIQTQDVIIYTTIAAGTAGGIGSCVLIFGILKRRKNKKTQTQLTQQQIQNIKEQDYNSIEQNSMTISKNYNNSHNLNAIDNHPEISQYAGQNIENIIGSNDLENYKYSIDQDQDKRQKRMNLNNVKLDPLHFNVQTKSLDTK